MIKRQGPPRIAAKPIDCPTSPLTQLAALEELQSAFAFASVLESAYLHA